LFRQRLDNVHTTFLKNEIVVSGLISSNSAGIAPKFNTKSRVVEPSPAMLPRAHTACSATCIYDEPRSCTSFGTAPCFTTVFVCSDVPDAMLVSAHEASNCKEGLSKWDRNSTHLGTIPALIMASIGGFLSLLSVFRALCVAIS